MSDDELRAITDSELRLAVGYWSGKLANQRIKAMAYYLAEPKLDLSPPEIEGRSSVVSPDVRNTIEAMLPQLMVKFAGSDRIVEFEATKPGQEQMAEQATDYCNHLLFVKNSGERLVYNWMKDALLSKNGIVKVWWDTRGEEKREEYTGLSDIELSQLMDDEEIEIVEQKSYPDEEDAEQRADAIAQIQQQIELLSQQPQPQQQIPQQPGQPPQPSQIEQLQQRLAQIDQTPPKMLFDVVCQRQIPGGRVRVENVPPEEFLISRKAKSIADATFVGHRVARTVSELKSQGYKNVDNISSDDQATSLNMERIERLAYDDELAYLQTDSQQNIDDSQRVVWVTECYLRVDYDGDGIAEFRKVVRAGNQILDNEVVDIAPFVSICPVPMPHKFFGLSVADLAMESQRIKTSILRGVLDNAYLQINKRLYAVEGQVNLDDLLTSRPGGIVRMRAPQMAGPLDPSPGDASLGMGMLQYMAGFQEEATGWTRYNGGMDGDTLNATATGVNQITNRADMRLDLIARNFAEGFRELFRLMLRLCSQYTQKEQIVNLRGQWVPVNPREWRNGFDATINVGLGVGNKDQTVAHLNLLIQQQALALQDGTAQPQNLYESRKELAKALGYKNGEKFFSDPARNPPQQPQVDPLVQAEQVKAQSNQQIAQLKAQVDAQSAAQKAQMDAQQAQLTQQLKERELMAKMQADAAAAEHAAQIEREKIERQALTDIEVAKIKAQAEIEKAIAIERIRLEFAMAHAPQIAGNA